MFKELGETLVIVLDLGRPVSKIGACIVSSKGDSGINDDIESRCAKSRGLPTFHRDPQPELVETIPISDDTPRATRIQGMRLHKFTS